jgi:predicted double-glycine peptidase
MGGLKLFPHYHQSDIMDCGPMCLLIIAKYYGRNISLPKIRMLSGATRYGTSLKGIASASEEIGFRALGVKINYDKLKEDAPLPCIIHWKREYFVVVYKIQNKKIFISDPTLGLLELKKQEFIQSWIGDNNEEGITLLLEPTSKLKKIEDDDDMEYTLEELAHIKETEKMLSIEKKLPPASQMIRNLAIDHWRTLKAFMKCYQAIAPINLAEKRWDTCLNCDFLLYDETNQNTNKKDGRCTHCGCFMSVKVHYVVSKCPIDKWEGEEGYVPTIEMIKEGLEK